MNNLKQEHLSIAFENFKVRELDEKTKKIIISLYVEFFSVKPRYEIIDKNLVYKEIFEKEQSFITLLLFRDKIIGYIHSYDMMDFTDSNLIENLKNNSSYICSLGVKEKYRNMKLGTTLINYHINYLKSKLYENIYIRCRNDVFSINKILSKDFNKVLEYEVTTNNIKSLKTIYVNELK